MAILHKSDQRGGGKMGWLDTAHTFSFGQFRDPHRMGFRNLRVLNEDRVVPGAGFPPHSHSDMDIVTYVISGALKHEDSLGTGSIIEPGDIQRMSAGTGITHSEMNASATAPVHFLQIWIIPDRAGNSPGYEQKQIDRTRAHADFWEIAGPAPSPTAVRLFSDTRIHLRHFEEGDTARFEVDGGRGAFVQLVAGKLTVSGEELTAGDGIEADGPFTLDFAATTRSELLIFDLP